MIPVDESVIRKVDMTIHDKDNGEVKAHKRLMQKQLKWCREHVHTIENRANKVYDKVVNDPEFNRKRNSRKQKDSRILC